MDLYGEIILDHYKNPQHKGRMEKPATSAEDVNPLCGDKIRMDFQISNDGVIEDVVFSGEGCAISQASASMLTDKLMGKKIQEISALDNDFIFQMLQVQLTPARIKCALLALAVAKKAAILYKLK